MNGCKALAIDQVVELLNELERANAQRIELGADLQVYCAGWLAGWLAGWMAD